MSGVARLAAYWAEVFGGPPRYSESFGGQSAMLVVHAGKPAGLPTPRWSWDGVQGAAETSLS